MSNIYDGILRRLVQYRIALNLTQTDVGTIVGKTQSQFSKMELGKTVLSFADLKAMLQAGWDIDYLIVAKERKVWTSSIAEFWDTKDTSIWENIKEVLFWAIGQMLTESGELKEKDIYCEYKLLKLIMAQKEKDSLLFELRSIIGISQTAMAERLGVNIKKYRDLERSITDLDAELLALVYESTACRPSLFFNQDNLETYLFNDLWNKLNVEAQKKIAVFMNYAINLRGV